MHPTIRHLCFRVGLALAILPALSAAPKNKKGSPPPETKGSIEVIGHLQLPPGPAVSLMTAVHWRRNYLYVEHGSQGAVTVVDVTDPRAPKAAGEFVPPPGSAPLHVGEVEGNAAMFTAAQPAPGTQAPESVTIMSFDDPAHPRIVRQFSHVACLLKDARRSLTYLVNDEGLWLLYSNPGRDRELEEEYDRYLRYSH